MNPRILADQAARREAAKIHVCSKCGKPIESDGLMLQPTLLHLILGIHRTQYFHTDCAPTSML